MYRLTPEGQRVAWELWMESMMEEKMAIKEAFKRAIKGKGILQYTLACICIGLCFPIGMAWAVIKILFTGR